MNHSIRTGQVWRAPGDRSRRVNHVTVFSSLVWYSRRTASGGWGRERRCQGSDFRRWIDRTGAIVTEDPA
jgi:hypothetical protein